MPNLSTRDSCGLVIESTTHDEIARLAFSLYEARGRQDGHYVEDWLRAEQKLVRHDA
jgi:hypothetical protein